jgi:hypothetical protein
VTFWTEIDAQLDRIEAEKPGTFSKVAAILAPITDQGAIYGTPPDPTPWQSRINSADRREEPDAFPEMILTYGVDYLPNTAFFAGSGGDRWLSNALIVAGWHVTYLGATYYYVAEHPTTGEQLTYIEGDVLRGDAR